MFVVSLSFYTKHTRLKYLHLRMHFPYYVDNDIVTVSLIVYVQLHILYICFEFSLAEDVSARALLNVLQQYKHYVLSLTCTFVIGSPT